jgi:hypothetical protein
VYDSEDEQRIRHLPMKPYRFVKGQPSNSGSGESNEVPAHRQHDKSPINGQDKTCSSGEPHRPLQCIEGVQSVV